MKSKSTISITFLPQYKIVEASHRDESILQAALRSGVQIDHSCDGNGTCGTCLVTVEKGLELLGPRDFVEQEIADDRQLRDDERLCCQNRPQDGLILRVGHKKD